jgi:hypothetical protein
MQSVSKFRDCKRREATVAARSKGEQKYWNQRSLSPSNTWLAIAFTSNRRSIAIADREERKPIAGRPTTVFPRRAFRQALPPSGGGACRSDCGRRRGGRPAVRRDPGRRFVQCGAPSLRAPPRGSRRREARTHATNKSLTRVDPGVAVYRSRSLTPSAASTASSMKKLPVQAALSRVRTA